jgi:uncharacterized protein (UPF0264 family)
MRLLVSVASAEEASAALAGGADVIDAKNPSVGPLGAVSIDVAHQIRAVVAPATPFTAALGDADDETSINRSAAQFASAGATLVKIGLGAIKSMSRAARLLDAAIEGANSSGAGVIVVAYADAERAAALDADRILDVARDSGVRGVLLDTADKSGPGLRALMAAENLSAWVSRAHAQGLLVALAGRLTADDLAFVSESGADIAGMRGAACEGGRLGLVSAEKVRTLKDQLRAMAVDSIEASESIRSAVRIVTLTPSGSAR